MRRLNPVSSGAKWRRKGKRLRMVGPPLDLRRNPFMQEARRSIWGSDRLNRFPATRAHRMLRTATVKVLSFRRMFPSVEVRASSCESCWEAFKYQGHCTSIISSLI